MKRVPVHSSPVKVAVTASQAWSRKQVGGVSRELGLQRNASARPTLRHGGQQFELHASFTPHSLRLLVLDASFTHPRLLACPRGGFALPFAFAATLHPDLLLGPTPHHLIFGGKQTR